MRKHSLLVLLLLIFISILTSCSTRDEGAGDIKYDETKKMVVDILKTEDGKKAIKEVLQDEEMKQELVLENSVVSESIQNALLSDKGAEFWKKQFENPEFAKTFAESMKPEQEKLVKDLLKDPEVREKLVELLHDPELEKELSDLLKSNEYRTHLQTVITETLESPLYQAKIQEILLKAATEQSKKEEGGSGGGGGESE